MSRPTPGWPSFSLRYVKRRRCYHYWFGRWRCPLTATHRVTGPGGSVPFCALHARNWRGVKDYRVTENNW